MLSILAWDVHKLSSMYRSTKTVLILTLLMSSISVIGICFAADYGIKDELAAYNAGNFKQVIEIGSAIVAKNPENVVAHYYLANAYAHEKLLAKAAQEYAICAKTESNKEIKSYAEAALKLLKGQADTNTSEQTAKASDNDNQATAVHTPANPDKDRLEKN